MKLPGEAFLGLVEQERPDCLVHCAGPASVHNSVVDSASDFYGSTVVTFEILKALQSGAPKCRFLQLSSAAVYGEPADLPVKETHTLNPISPYGFHKWQCELVCQEFAKVYGQPTAIVRIFSAYGAGLRRHP